MKLKILAALTIASSLNALELRIGNGTFDWKMGIAKFMDVSFGLDINTISLSEPHGKISDTKFYYFFDADIYSSDFVDQMTNLVTTPIRHEFPVFGSVNDAIEKYTPIPTSSDYKIRGFDVNLGVGYEFVREKNSYLGVGISTGLSLPVMKMQNLKKSAEFTYDLLDKTETTIKTYKLGPTLSGNIEIADRFMASASMGFGLQTGSIENDWIRSSMDVDGAYSFMNLAVSYAPLAKYPEFIITLGHNNKKWEMDDVKADMFNIFQVQNYGMFDSGFTVNNFYLGAGYTF